MSRLMFYEFMETILRGHAVQNSSFAKEITLKKLLHFQVYLPN